MATVLSESADKTNPNQIYSLVPKTLSEAMDYAKMIANSNFCPKDLKGKAEDVLIAMQLGAELGLKPLQSVQNIAVINGRPSVWGDASLALVRACPDFEDIREWIDNQNGVKTAHCASKRRGQTEQVRSFSVEDAKRAGLFNKQGPWSQYPDRMLQMRARGFNLRDVFTDVLKGFILAEEAYDIPVERDVTSTPPIQTPTSKLEAIKMKFNLQPELPPKDIASEQVLAAEEVSSPSAMFSVSDVEQMIATSKTLDELNSGIDLMREFSDEDKKTLRIAYTAKLKELREAQSRAEKYGELEDAKT